MRTLQEKKSHKQDMSVQAIHRELPLIDVVRHSLYRIDQQKWSVDLLLAHADTETFNPASFSVLVHLNGLHVKHLEITEWNVPATSDDIRALERTLFVKCAEQISHDLFPPEVFQ